MCRGSGNGQAYQGQGTVAGQEVLCSPTDDFLQGVKSEAPVLGVPQARQLKSSLL